MEKTLSLKFFRDFYRIPRTVGIGWCILVEHSPNGETVRLGVSLPADNKAIDVAARQFIQLGLPALVTYNAYPAVRKIEGDEVVFSGSGYEIKVPKTYVADIYYRSVYSKEMVQDTLL